MRHRSKKIKIQFGKDANKMLMRKLAVNFITRGKITTTSTKGRALKPYLERLMEKAKKNNEANKNSLLKNLASPELVQTLFTSVGTSMRERIGGYVTVQKLYRRDSDGALMVRLQWSESKKSKQETVDEKQP